MCLFVCIGKNVYCFIFIEIYLSTFSIHGDEKYMF